ncbi:MAG TPA: IclR family transcriptional regulator [Bryobacteraceae bacterium]|nr:IclR family transcriptional regulator [Bryobacteraceae bacterium]
MKTPSVPALERALAIIELLAGSRAGLTLPEIAKELELPKSSVHCLLITLERHRYLHRNDRTSRYLFSPKLFSVANMSLSGLQLRQVAMPHMHALTRLTGLETHLAVLERYEAVLMEKVEPPGASKLATWLGKRMDLHCTGVGKALIADLPDEEFGRLMRETGMPRHNDNTIRSLRKLKEDLARSRQAGYYIDDEEDEIGYRCIGAPIFDETGQTLAAISVSGSTVQVREDNSKALANQVVRTADAITKLLLEHGSNPTRGLDKPLSA